MAIPKFEFVELERSLKQTTSPWLDVLAPEEGAAYVVAITRDGCPACARQMPTLERLAEELGGTRGSRIDFTIVHVNWREDSKEESLRCKNLFRHYFYPTDLVLMRTRDAGAIEYYRATAPRLSDLKRSILSAAKTAESLAKEYR